MTKFIYPISSSVWKKRNAWKKLYSMAEDYGIDLIRPRIREETFDSESIFHDDEGRAFLDRRRTFTFTFSLNVEHASQFLAKLCNTRQKLARILHNNTVLVLIDDELPALAP